MISAEQLAAISAQAAGEAVLSDDTATRLRANFPALHFTYCMDDDIASNAKPVHTDPRFNLYLVDSSSHCAHLTNDLDLATGVVVAERDED